MNKQITGALFKGMVLHGAACITLEKQPINDLNVFPVPDGDTGTNMSMTIAAAAITAEKQAINDLNVFPVPDGDTGTNMSMTIAAAVTELRKNDPATVEKAASITSSALLRGARGT